MKLPYSTSKCNVPQAQARIIGMLRKFGVDKVSFEEDFAQCIFTIKFQYKEYPVSLPVDYKALAELYLKQDPYTHRKHCTFDVWLNKQKEVAYRGLFSIMEDFLKANITMIAIGALSFEEVFISSFIGPQGKRLGEYFKIKLPELVANGRLALGAGDE